jgi:hypothetical protein
MFSYIVQYLFKHFFLLFGQKTLILLGRGGHYSTVNRIYKYTESRGLFEVVLIGST